MMACRSGVGKYLHICSWCGRDFYTDQWYIGAYPQCPACRADEGESFKLAPSRGTTTDTAGRLVAKKTAEAVRERLDREYEANPPKTVVTVENGVRVERRGVVPAGANAGRGPVPVSDGSSGFS